MIWRPWVVFGLLVLVVGYRLWNRRGLVYISVHEVKARLDARDPMLLIDVRQPREFNAGHIPGAVNLPLNSLSEEASRLDPAAEVILVCQSGQRSTTAYRKLKSMGFSDLRHLEGGMLRWAWKKEKEGGR